MFRFFKYIILIVLGYEVLKMLFAETPASTKTAENPPPPQDNKQFFKNTESTPSPSVPHKKYDDAELIDYEELK